MGAVAAHFQSCDHDVKLAIALDLTFQPVEEITLEFSDSSAAKTGHVDVGAFGATFVEVLLSLHVHEIEFINEPMSFEQSQGAVDGHAVNGGIHFSRAAKDLAGVKMLFGSFNDAENGAALAGHA